MALVSTGALAQQQNNPTDPSAPSGGCTGFPGDSASCNKIEPALPNETVPEEPEAPDLDTQSGDQEPLPMPNTNGNQLDLPSGASPDNPATNPDAGSGN
ncbi:MAG: hypothetical protein IPK59_18050 [Rhodospirillaceae bacterium]|nr:hypothetical protein [Rhodospirillaceae bacterium]